MADNNQLLKEAQEVYQRVAAKVAKVLGLPALPVTFGINTQTNNPAIQYGDERILLNPKFFRENPDQLAGVIVHELVNRYADNNDDVLADAVRFQLTGTKGGWTPSDRSRNLAGSPQQITARAGGEDAQKQQVFQDDKGNWYINDGGNIVRVTEAEAQKYVQGTLGQGGTETTEGGDIGLSTKDLLAALGSDDEGTTAEERRARIQRERNMTIGFQSQVSAMGIGMTPNLQALVDQAVNRGYSGTSFMYFLRQTPEYAKAFPGIFNRDGSLKMSEAQYLSNVSQYKSIAAQSGLNLGQKQIGWLFKNDVSPSEYAIKAPAVARVKRDPQLYRAFQRELVQGGVAGKGEVTQRELLKFAAGMGNRAWYDLWQDTVTRNAAIDAGIAVKRGARGYATITQQMLEKISDKGLSEADSAARFAELAEHLLTTLPEGIIQGYGKNLKRKLATAEFGGPGAARTKELVKRIARNQAAFSEPRATAPEPETRPTGVIAPQRPEA